MGFLSTISKKYDDLNRVDLNKLEYENIHTFNKYFFFKVIDDIYLAKLLELQDTYLDTIKYDTRDNDKKLTYLLEDLERYKNRDLIHNFSKMDYEKRLRLLIFNKEARRVYRKYLFDGIKREEDMLMKTKDIVKKHLNSENTEVDDFKLTLFLTHEKIISDRLNYFINFDCGTKQNVSEISDLYLSTKPLMDQIFLSIDKFSLNSENKELKVVDKKYILIKEQKERKVPIQEKIKNIFLLEKDSRLTKKHDEFVEKNMVVVKVMKRANEI